jgi:hypothetical protein
VAWVAALTGVSADVIAIDGKTLRRSYQKKGARGAGAPQRPRPCGSGLWPSQLGPVIRGHWSVENSLHWVMDMIFRDDECCIRTDHAPANFTTLKHMAHNLIRRALAASRFLPSIPRIEAYTVWPAEQGFRRVAAKAAASAGDQDCFGHARSP